MSRRSEMEVYTAITYDSRFLGPAMTISLAGGVEVEDVEDNKKVAFPVDVFKGLGAYQASEILSKLDCPKSIVSVFSRILVDF